MRSAALTAVGIVVGACSAGVHGGWGPDPAARPPYWNQLTANSAAFEHDISPALTAVRTMSGAIASIEADPTAPAVTAAVRPAQGALQEAATEIDAIPWVPSYRVEVAPVLNAAANLQQLLAEAPTEVANLAPWIAKLSASSDQLNHTISALRTVLPSPPP